MAAFCKINSKLLPLKIHVFLFFFGMCGPGNFQPNIAKQAGLSTSAMGVIFASIPLIVMVTKAMLGIIADKFHALRFLTVFGVFASAVVLVPYIFIPKLEKSRATFLCSSNETTIVRSSNDVSDEQIKLCEITPDNDAEFLDMCYEWNNNLEHSIARTSTLNLNCNRTAIIAEFFQFQTNSSRYGIIRQIRDNSTNNSGIPDAARCLTTKTATVFVKCYNVNGTSPSTLFDELRSPIFLYICVAYIVFNVLTANVLVYTDTISYQILGDDSDKYGAQRMFGSVGWGIAGIISGALIDYFSDNNATDKSYDKNYTPIYVISIAVILLDAIWCLFKLEVKQSKSDEFDFKKVAKLFKQFDVVVFACWCLWCGVVQQVVWTFVNWYLEELCDAKTFKYFKTLQGIFVFMNSLLGDTISFYLYGWLSKKMNIDNRISLVLVLNAIRCLAYAIVNTPLWGILIASLDGIIFGLTYSIITSNCNKIAVRGTETTVQATFNCVFDGIGTSIGGICGGMLYTWLGGANLFKVFGYLCSAAFVAHLILRTISRLLTKSRLENTNNSRGGTWHFNVQEYS